MRRMRSNNKAFTALALVAIVAVCAAPALAAESATGGQTLELRLAVTKLGDWAEQAAREERRRERAEGPFVPIVGKVDYGTAENAFGAARSGHVHAGQDMFAQAGHPADRRDRRRRHRDRQRRRAGQLRPPLRPEARAHLRLHAHDRAAEVRAGERVQAGEELGGVGCTGSCWGDHLHFEVRDGRGWEAEAARPAAAASGMALARRARRKR